jgi:nucleotide-binding universal stress UspA family protein
MTSSIMVGVDGSDHAQRAVAWCATHAAALGAEVIVLHAIPVPTYVGLGPPYIWLTHAPAEVRDALLDGAARDWCKPLSDAGVPFRVMLVDGQAAPALMEAARAEGVDLVVVGRRGFGGFKELLVGSTSYELTHHLDRPLLIVP